VCIEEVNLGVVDSLGEIKCVLVGQRADFGRFLTVPCLSASGDLVHRKSPVEHVRWRVPSQLLKLDRNMDPQEFVQVQEASAHSDCKISKVEQSVLLKIFPPSILTKTLFVPNE